MPLGELAGVSLFEVMMALEGVLSRLGERALEGVPTDLGRTPGKLGIMAWGTRRALRESAMSRFMSLRADGFGVSSGRS